MFAIKSGKHVCQKSCFFEVAPIVPESFMIYIYILYIKYQCPDVCIYIDDDRHAGPLELELAEAS